MMRFSILNSRCSRTICGAVACLWLAGCNQSMRTQPKYQPLQESAFFPDGASARPLVPDTVSRGPLQTNELLETGRVNGRVVDSFPFPITIQVLQRGQERYNIYCSPCHGFVGDGQGTVPQRGFPHPPSYHVARLRRAPVGHYFDVITHGYGTMYSYASRVERDDRWAIAAYIRALQISQNATVSDVPSNEQAALHAAFAIGKPRLAEARHE